MKHHFHRSQPILAGLMALLFVASACTPSAAPVSKSKSPVRLGVTQWVGLAPLFIADEKGFFKESGVDIALTVYDSQPTAIQNFVERRIDATTGTLADALGVAASTGERANVVWAFDSSSGGDVVVGSATVANAADLKSKRIGLSYGTFSHMFVLAGLERVGLKESDIQVVNLTETEVVEALKAGTIDAGHTWNPHLAKALANGGKVIFTSADTPSIIVDVLIIDSSIVSERPEDVQAILSAMNRANEWWQQNAAEGNEIVAKRLGMTAPEVADTVLGVKLYGTAENIAAFGDDADLSLVKGSTYIINFLIEKAIIKRKPDTSVLFAPSFVKSLAKVN